MTRRATADKIPCCFHTQPVDAESGITGFTRTAAGRPEVTVPVLPSAAVCIFPCGVRYLGIYVDFPWGTVSELSSSPAYRLGDSWKAFQDRLWDRYRCWQVPQHSASSGKSSPNGKTKFQVYNKKPLELGGAVTKRCSRLK